MLTANFYQMQSEINYVNKSKYLLFSSRIILKEESSILTPTIRLVGVVTDSVFKCNYVHISEFNRYYFVTDITIERENVYVLQLKNDVLPYLNAMTNQDCFVSRFEKGDKKLIDKKRPFYNYPYYFKTKRTGRRLGLLPFDESKSDRLSLDKCWIFVTIAAKGYPSELYFPDYTVWTGDRAEDIEFSPYNLTVITLAFKTITAFSSFLQSIAFEDTKITPYILGFRVYPLDIENSPLITGFSEVTMGKLSDTGNSYGFYLPVGDKDIPVSLSTELKEHSDVMYVNKDMNTLTGKITIENSELKLLNDYRDLEPYSKYILHLPWLGDVDINAEVLLAEFSAGQLNDIIVEYAVDWTIGDLTYKVSIGGETTNRQLFINSCSIGSQIPYTYNNSADVERLNNKYTAQMVTQSIVSAGMFAAGLATFVGTPAKDRAARMMLNPIENVLSGAGSVAQTGFEMITNVPQGQVSSSNSNHCNGILSDPYVYVVKYTMQQVEFEGDTDDNYKHLYGIPYNKVVKFGTLVNIFNSDPTKPLYVEITDIHIEPDQIFIEEEEHRNIITLTMPSEIEELRNILANGIYVS